MTSCTISKKVVLAASMKGNAHASWMLAKMFAFGIGAESSLSRSSQYLQKAAVQGSLRAQRDLALSQLGSAHTPDERAHALATLLELSSKGLSRTQIGEALMLSKDPHYVNAGITLLTLESYQFAHWRARYLVLLARVFETQVPEGEQERLTALNYKFECEGNSFAQHAALLGNLLGLSPWIFTFEHIAKELLEINSPEATIDVWELLMTATFKHLNEELKNKAFRQLSAHADAGHLHAQAVHRLALLNHAQFKDEMVCAENLLTLFKAHPELHSTHYDYPIHRAKPHSAGLSELFLETLKVIAESELAPYAKRTLAIELNLAERYDEAALWQERAFELDIESGVSGLASESFRVYFNTGEQYEAARFWAEAYIFEHPTDGQTHMQGLLEYKQQRTPLTEEEILTRKNCLDFLTAKGSVEAKRELGLMLLRGETSIDTDPERGLALLKEAAESDGRAMYELAHVYQAGVHVPCDMNLAQHYFDEAAKNGHSNAQYEERHMQRQNEDKKNNNESVMQPEGTLLKLPQPQEIDESP